MRLFPSTASGDYCQMGFVAGVFRVVQVVLLLAVAFDVYNKRRAGTAR